MPLVPTIVCSAKRGTQSPCMRPVFRLAGHRPQDVANNTGLLPPGLFSDEVRRSAGRSLRPRRISRGPIEIDGDPSLYSQYLRLAWFAEEDFLQHRLGRPVHVFDDCRVETRHVVCGRLLI